MPGVVAAGSVALQSPATSLRHRHGTVRRPEHVPRSRWKPRSPNLTQAPRPFNGIIGTRRSSRGLDRFDYPASRPHRRTNMRPVGTPGRCLMRSLRARPLPDVAFLSSEKRTSNPLFIWCVCSTIDALASIGNPNSLTSPSWASSVESVVCTHPNALEGAGDLRPNAPRRVLIVCQRPGQAPFTMAVAAPCRTLSWVENGDRPIVQVALASVDE